MNKSRVFPITEDWAHLDASLLSTSLTAEQWWAHPQERRDAMGPCWLGRYARVEEGYGDSSLRAEIAAHPNVSPRTLAYLITFAGFWDDVVEEVVCNPRTPLKAIRTFLARAGADSRLAAAECWRTPDSVLAILAEDGAEEVREAAKTAASRRSGSVAA